ncbi:3-deoxy-7-phosphoheptulonate synthase [Streptomyces tubercidicus]|uniref:Phospho-2-dehydro-3-deoxyheptonate aldolase n=1 Tax=Streptomyces tubercidicus TaxID=47759 RepID=A0A640UVM0_9ACTN|nr:3-deoxy-7-phosphoheptulonate synthase [Streptomyces tubercidicus]WAU14441.1 3-deoxy-7-phosphoheptulonate synthase [Streptomyces tubercidicus]GFE40178.1 phospho-2-dehydro-3-deoxyheptonate aldolase [Streptomyces tubercidicus]
MDEVLRDIRSCDALQQPEWTDLPQVDRVGEALAGRPALVQAADLRVLRGSLARVAAGEAMVIQAGDCAEDPGECTPQDISRKAALLDVLAGALRMEAHKPVIRVGRIAGQLAKPRSSPTETVGGVEIPTYRGHMVNGIEPDPEARRPDPLRILTGYMAADDIMEYLGWRRRAAGQDPIGPLVWTSHEALLLAYELPMLRTDERGRLFLGSTHWPWIGERTRQLDGAHVALLAQVDNPVACKVGPSMEPAELLALCERLDPDREPGRLTLIARMGVGRVAERLPLLVEAVRAAGHPVIWLTDPMHGNTVAAPDGNKTRHVETVSREVVLFQQAVRAAGGVCGGLHLETTPNDVTECVSCEADLDHVGDKYTTFCDPRLNPRQAVSVVSAWSA